MYGQYGHARKNLTFASNAKESSVYDISGANKIAVEIAAFDGALATTTANIFVKGCNTSDGTFRRIKQMGIYSAASGIHDWEVPSTTGDFIAVCDAALGFSFIKLELSNTATAGFTGGHVHVFH